MTEIRRAADVTTEDIVIDDEGLDWDVTHVSPQRIVLRRRNKTRYTNSMWIEPDDLVRIADTAHQTSVASTITPGGTT